MRRFVPLLIPALAAANPDIAPYVEATAVVAKPRTSIANLDPGFGAHVIAGLQIGPVSVFAGYRKIWSGITQTYLRTTHTDVWTEERMFGARFTRQHTERLGWFAEAYVARVVLDSRSELGGSDSAWHHRGTGFGARGGGAWTFAPHVSAVAALGVSHAETKYDDEMGVGWFAFELGVAGAW